MIIFGLLHITLSSLFAYALGSLFGQLNLAIAIISLVGAFVTSLYLLDYDSIDFLNLRLSSWRLSTAGVLEKIVFILVLFVAVRHFVFLFYQVDHEYRTLHPFNLGDLPLHIHYIRNLASGVEFPLVNPNFSTELLRYPYGIDLYNALWEIVGVPTGGHLFLVGIFSSVAALVCLRLAGSWLGMISFFFSGGFIAIARNNSLEMQNLLGWKNLFLSMFITQRGLLWALPVGVLMIYFLVLNGRRNHEAPIHGRTFLIMGILWGALAFFHLHSFFILSLMIAANAIYRFYKADFAIKNAFKELNKYIFIWIWPATIGLWFSLFSLNFFQSPGLVHWRFGWTYESSQNFLYYLSANLGTYLFLFFGVALYLWRHKRRSLYFELFINVFLFALFFNLILAPWSWDNIKILIWPYLALNFLSFETLRKHWEPWTQVVLLLSLSYGGLFALSGPQFSIASRTSIYSVSDLANEKGALLGLPANAIFASGTTYNHELTALGRNRVMGYEGHLWAHGIAYAQTKQKFLKLMAGTDGWLQIAHDLRANFILWGPRERSEFDPKGEFKPQWRTELKNISRVKDYEVYEVP